MSTQEHVLIENVLKSILNHVQFSIFEFIASTEMEKRRSLRDKIESALEKISRRSTVIKENQKTIKLELEETLTKAKKSLVEEELGTRCLIEGDFLESFTEIRLMYIRGALQRIGVSNSFTSLETDVEHESKNSAGMKERCSSYTKICNDFPHSVEECCTVDAPINDVCTEVPYFPSIEVLDVLSMGCSYFENEEVIRLSLEGIEKMIHYGHFRCECISDASDFACAHCSTISSKYSAADIPKGFIAQELKSECDDSLNFLPRCSCEHCSLMNTLFHHAIFPIYTLVCDKGTSGPYKSLKSSSQSLLVYLIRVIAAAVSKSLVHSALLCHSMSVLVEIALGCDDGLDILDGGNKFGKQSPLYRSKRLKRLSIIEEIVKLRIENIELSGNFVEIDGYTYSTESVFQSIQPLFDVTESDETVSVSTLYFIPALALSSLKQVVIHLISGFDGDLMCQIETNSRPEAERRFFLHLHDLFSVLNYLCAKEHTESSLSMTEAQPFHIKTFLKENTHYEKVFAHYKYTNIIRFLNDLIAIPSSFKETAGSVIFVEYISIILQNVQRSEGLKKAFVVFYPVYCFVQKWFPLFKHLIRAAFVESPLIYKPTLSNVLPTFLSIMASQVTCWRKVQMGNEMDDAKISRFVQKWSEILCSEAHAVFKKYIDFFLMIFVFPAFLHEKTSNTKRFCLLESMKNIFCDNLEHSQDIDLVTESHTLHCNKSGRAFQMFMYFDCDILCADVTTQFIGVICRFISLLQAEIKEFKGECQIETKWQNNSPNQQENLIQEVRKGLVITSYDMLRCVFSQISSQGELHPRDILVRSTNSAEESVNDSQFFVDHQFELKKHFFEFVHLVNERKSYASIDLMKKSGRKKIFILESACNANISDDDFAMAFAKHLIGLNGLQPGAICDFLSEPEPQCITSIREEFFSLFRTAGEALKNSHFDTKAKLNHKKLISYAFMLLWDIEHSFRAFLRVCPLPKEGQKIERVVESFCVAWFQKSRRVYVPERAENNTPAADSFMKNFPTSDAVYLLCFAMLMLNTELHSRVLNNAAKKVNQKLASADIDTIPSFQQFYQPLQYVDGLKNFKKNEIVDLYMRIEQMEFQSRKVVDIHVENLDMVNSGIHSSYTFPPFAGVHDVIGHCTLKEGLERISSIYKETVPSKDDDHRNGVIAHEIYHENQGFSKEQAFSGTVINIHINELDNIIQEFNEVYTMPEIRHEPHLGRIKTHSLCIPYLSTAIDLQKIVLDIYATYHKDSDKNVSSKLTAYTHEYERFITNYVNGKLIFQKEVKLVLNENYEKRWFYHDANTSLEKRPVLHEEFLAIFCHSLSNIMRPDFNTLLSGSGNFWQDIQNAANHLFRDMVAIMQQ